MSVEWLKLRLLNFAQVYDFIIKEGIKSGELKKAEQMTSDVQNEYKKYFDSIVDKYIKTAKITISDKYKAMFKGF